LAALNPQFIDLQAKPLRLELTKDLKIPATEGLDKSMGHVVSFQKGQGGVDSSGHGCALYLNSSEHFDRTLSKGTTLEVHDLTSVSSQAGKDSDLPPDTIILRTPNHPEVYQILCKTRTRMFFQEPQTPSLRTLEDALGMKIKLNEMEEPLALAPPQTNCMNLMEGSNLPVEPCTKRKALRLLPTQDCIMAFSLVDFPQMDVAVKYCQSPSLWHPKVRACAVWKARQAILQSKSPAKAIDSCRKNI